MSQHRAHTLRLRRIKAILNLAATVLGIASPAAMPASAEQQVVSNDHVVTQAAAPAAELSAIRLTGESANPVGEEWETRTESRLTSPAVTELWVRNVSQPTLERFLPDPARANGAAMIIAPGGAFLELAIEREGYSVAKWLNDRGIAAFVLKYRVAPTPADPRQAAAQMTKWAREKLLPSLGSAGGTPPAKSDPLTAEQREARAAAVQSGLEAIRYVRSHAAEWNLSPARIGFIGFSAGALTAMGVARQADAASRPDVVASIYGGLPDDAPVPTTVPPVFIVAAADDLISSSSLAIYTSWRKNAVPAELHVLESGGHGFGMLHRGTSSDQWPQLFDYWLTAHGFRASNAMSASKTSLAHKG